MLNHGQLDGVNNQILVSLKILIKSYFVYKGTTSSGGSTATLLQNVKLTVYNNSICSNYGNLNNHQLCAGEYAGGKDTCQGKFF